MRISEELNLFQLTQMLRCLREVKHHQHYRLVKRLLKVLEQELSLKLVKLQQNRATEFLNPTPPLSEAEIDERVYHWQQLGFTLVGELSREQFA